MSFKNATFYPKSKKRVIFLWFWAGKSYYRLSTVWRNGLFLSWSITFGFDVTTTKPTSFYKITGPDGTYIGQTTRTIEERFAEHGLAKGWTRENGWDVEPLGETKHLTPYEAAVWEQHYIEQNGGKDKLLNKRNEITEKKYDAYAHKHNPCK